MSFSGPSQHRCKCFGEGDGPNGTYYPCPPELCEADAILERAEAAEAELQRLRGGISVRDALVTENAIRAAAAEAEVQRLREGLRKALAALDDEATLWIEAARILRALLAGPSAQVPAEEPTPVSYDELRGYVHGGTMRSKSAPLGEPDEGGEA